MPKKQPTKKPATRGKSKDRLMLESIIAKINETGFYDELCADGQDTVRQIAKHIGVDLVDAYCKYDVGLEDITINVPDEYTCGAGELEARVILTHKPSGTVFDAVVGIYEVSLSTEQ